MDQLGWKPSSLHTRKIVICDADRNPLLLVGFQGAERYSPIKVVCQFRWAEMTQVLNKVIDNSSKIDLADRNEPSSHWLRDKKVESQLH